MGCTLILASNFDLTEVLITFWLNVRWCNVFGLQLISSQCLPSSKSHKPVAANRPADNRCRGKASFEGDEAHSASGVQMNRFLEAVS